jgi:hypothetical protein
MSTKPQLRDLAVPGVTTGQSRNVRGGIIAVLIGLFRPKPSLPAVQGR